MAGDSYSCAQDQDKTVKYSQLDYMVLFKSLDSIRITSKEFLEGRINNVDAFNRIKNEYDFYHCNVKKNLNESKSQKTAFIRLIGSIVFIILLAYNIYIVFQVYKFFTAKPYSISLIYALILIMLINPIFSLTTVTVEYFTYSTVSRIDVSTKEDIEDVERKIQEALSCGGPEAFTKERVCTYYKYFDRQDNENPDSRLCPCLEGTDCERNDSALINDRLTNKMVKMDNIYQFFENQKKYVYKTNNPFVQIKHSDKLDSVIKLLLGNNVEETVRHHLQSHERPNHLMSENSENIRNNVQVILKDLEGYRYDELGIVESYNKYFIEDTNMHIQDLVRHVFSFVSLDSNINEYVYNNPKMTNSVISEVARENAIFRCDNYNPVDGSYASNLVGMEIVDPSKEVILEKMFAIQVRLKRLNKLWLPEYEHLRAFLYDISKTDVNIQRAFYRATSPEDLTSLFGEIVLMVLNNNSLFTKKTVYLPPPVVANAANNGSDAMLQCFEERLSPDYVEKSHFRPNVINIRSRFPSDILVKETLMIPKMKTFIRNLKHNPLDTNFMNNYKTETSILKTILENLLEDMLSNVNKVRDYIIYYLKDSNVFNNENIEDGKKMELIFIKNVSSLIVYIANKREKEVKNSELYFSAQKDVELKNKYISFSEFEAKIDELERNQFGKYLDRVNEVNRDIVYFIDKLDDINNAMEKKHQNAIYYGQFIKIYIIVSFFILFDVVFNEFMGASFDEWMMKRINSNEALSSNLKEKMTDAKDKLSNLSDKVVKGAKLIKERLNTNSRELNLPESETTTLNVQPDVQPDVQSDVLQTIQTSPDELTQTASSKNMKDALKLALQNRQFIKNTTSSVSNLLGKANTALESTKSNTTSNIMSNISKLKNASNKAAQIISGVTGKYGVNK